jgi:hypothetical protein
MQNSMRTRHPRVKNRRSTMPTVTIPRTDITTEQISAALREGLDDRYDVLPGMRMTRIPLGSPQAADPDDIVVGKGPSPMVRAQVTARKPQTNSKPHAASCHSLLGRRPHRFQGCTVGAVLPAPFGPGKTTTPPAPTRSLSCARVRWSSLPRTACTVRASPITGQHHQARTLWPACVGFLVQSVLAEEPPAAPDDRPPPYTAGAQIADYCD